MGLVGPNGAGKTTAMECVAGILSPDVGTIQIDGAAPSRYAAGYAPQKVGLYPSQTARENLAFFCSLFGIVGVKQKQRIKELSELLRIASLLDRKVSMLSVGQARSVHVAVAMVHEPRVLLLDEPTAGLDVDARQAVLDAVRSLATAGTAILYSSHYMEEVQQLCDHTVVLHLGGVVATGRTADLLREHAQGWVTVRTSLGKNVRFEGVNVMAALGQVDTAVVTSVEVTPPSLATVFSKLTGTVSQLQEPLL
jgi:ABC-2 type transport system ATP-binding protein